MLINFQSICQFPTKKLVASRSLPLADSANFADRSSPPRILLPPFMAILLPVENPNQVTSPGWRNFTTRKIRAKSAATHIKLSVLRRILSPLSALKTSLADSATANLAARSVTAKAIWLPQLKTCLILNKVVCHHPNFSRSRWFIASWNADHLGNKSP